MSDAVKIPTDLLPADGRFGAGPSKIQTSHLDALAATGSSLMGTSHRQAPVKNTVGRVREGLADLFSLPDGYQVVLGNGGATAFWDIATFGLIEKKSQHLSFGEFSSKFAKAAAAAPWLDDAVGHRERAGLAARGGGRGRRRRLRLGAQRDLDRRDGAGGPRRPASDGLVLVDATSGAGGLPVDLTEVDAYYFAPQKCFASDGGLWIALMSPAALDRAAAIAASDRHIPAFFDLPTAIDNSGEEPDLQHPRRRHPVPDGRAAGLDERPGRPQGHGRAHHRLVRRALRLGRARRRTPRRTSSTRRTARWSSAPSTSTTRSTPRRSPRPCAPTASSTPSPTASSAATSSGSRCTPPSTPPTSRRSPTCIDYVVEQTA